MRPLVRWLFVYAAFSQTAFVDAAFSQMAFKYAAFSQMAFFELANMQGNRWRDGRRRKPGVKPILTKSKIYQF